MTHRNDPSLEEQLAAEATYHRAPDALRERLHAALALEEPPRGKAAPRRAPALAFAAALAAVAVVSWILALQFTAAPGRDDVERALLDAHLRSIAVESRLVDVPSSDEHTVKPWFAGKLDFAPTVADLSAQGFTLAGGRLDFVDGRRVAALTYRYRRHVVNVFMWPAAGEAAPARFTREGFTLVAWREGGLQYWAVSDAEPGPLLALARAWPHA